MNQSTMTRRSTIVFALVDSGMGHKSPALAVQEHLERVAPGRYDIVLVDLLAALGLRSLDTVVKRGWSDVLLRFPRLIDVIYWLFHTFAALLVPAIAWIVTPQLHFLERFCKRLDADLLVTTHFISNNSLAILRQRGRLGAPVVGMVVDPFETYRIAGHAGLDALVTYSRRSWSAYRSQLPSVQIERFGFPLSARYASPSRDRAAARRRLFVRAGRFVLLMTAGAEGVSNFHRFFERLVDASLDIHIVVVCGRNSVLRRQLQIRADAVISSGSTTTTCSLLGFVDNMDVLITACDVFLGAGGANLTFEALAVGRPLILTLTTPNIRGTIDYVVRNGFGWHCTREGEIVPLVKRLRETPRLLEEAERRIADAGIRSGTPELAGYLVGLLGHTLCDQTAEPDGRSRRRASGRGRDVIRAG